MNIDQEVEIPVTTVETVITTTADDVPILETTLEEVCHNVTCFCKLVFPVMYIECPNDCVILRFTGGLQKA